MEKSFDNTENEKESISRYERMVSDNSLPYLEVSFFQNIIQQYQNKNKTKEAISACKQGLEFHPFSLELKLLLSISLLELGEFHKSLKVVEEILLIQPTDTEYLSVKAELLLFLDRYEESHQLYSEILPLSSEKEHIYYQLSDAAQGMNNHDLAVSYLLKVLELNPSNEEAMFELYHSYDELNQLDECIIHLNRFIDQNPFSKHMWYNLAILYDRQGKFEEAIDCYEYAVAIDDKYSSAYYNMGAAYMVLKKFDLALKQFQYALDLETFDDPFLLQSTGHCYFELNEYSLALKNYQKALKKDPLLHESWYGVGLILEEQEKWLEAVHFFGQAHKIDENYPKYVKALAETEYQLGNIVSSIEYFEKAITLEKDDINTWISWSYIYHEQGDTEHAIKIILDALEELPDEAELYYRLTLSLIHI